MRPGEARAFVASNHRAVLVTRRSGGGLQTSPVLVGVDDERIEGTAQIVSLPEAMEGLVDYYRRISGEHPDWDDYRRAMQQEQRVLVRVSIDAAGPADAR
jgi:hypothetical protein